MSRTELDAGVQGGAVVKGPEAFRTISEVADELDLPQHVLRFWETRFAQIRPMKRGGGRRYYRPDDVDLLRGIRHLLYGEGYTIKGVQRILKEHGARFVVAAGRGAIARPAAAARAGAAPPAGEEGRRVEPPPLERPEARRHPDAAFEAPEIAVDPEDRADWPGADDGKVTRATRRLVESLRPDAAGDGTPGDLGAEDRERLERTLADLLECKRLLDSAR